MYLQTNVKIFDEILSKYQGGFRKSLNSQNCLASVVEKWREAIDSGDCFRVPQALY